jgi:catechol 2,3-dioxygenase-like lactoylglutathione lyase family enzyme
VSAVTDVRACPVFPVAELPRALEHYASLGFTTSTHDDRYGFAAWRGFELHLAVVPGIDPATSVVAAFLHVANADEVAAAWAGRWSRPARTVAPVDTAYGMREGAHVDPDGNLLRFGSPLPSGA